MNDTNGKIVTREYAGMDASNSDAKLPVPHTEKPTDDLAGSNGLNSAFVTRSDPYALLRDCNASTR